MKQEDSLPENARNSLIKQRGKRLAQRKITEKKELQRRIRQKALFRQASVFKQELKLQDHIIDEFVFQPSIPKCLPQIVKQDALAKLLKTYLFNDQKAFGLLPNIIMELTALIKMLQMKLIENFSEQQTKDYDQLVNQYNKEYQHFKKDKSARFKVNKGQKPKFIYFMKKNYPLKIESVVKLDILSCFFRFNAQYKKKYGPNLGGAVIRQIFLSKLFDIDKQDIDNFLLIYKQIEDWLSFDYEDVFRNFIILCGIIQLKQKAENTSKKKLDKEIMPFQVEQKEAQTSVFKFKFSQLAFIYNGVPLKKLSMVRRLEILETAKKIISLQTLKQQKQLYLFIKQKHKPSFELFDSILNGFSSNYEETMAKYAQQVKFMESVTKLPWYCYSCAYNQGLDVAFIKLGNQKIKRKQFYLKDNYFATHILLMAFERMKLLEEVTFAQLSLQKLVTNSEPIYIHRFQYSFNEVKHSQYSNLIQSADLKGTLILGVFKDKILFKSFVRSAVQDVIYGNICRSAIFNLKLTVKFSVVLNQFTFKKGGLDWKVFYNLSRYLHKNYEAYTYIVNSPSSFKLHLIMNRYILNWLRKSESVLTQTNFHQLLSKKIEKSALALNRIQAKE